MVKGDLKKFTSDTVLHRVQPRVVKRPTASLALKNRGSRENMPSEHFSVVNLCFFFLLINRFGSLFHPWITLLCTHHYSNQQLDYLTSQEASFSLISGLLIDLISSNRLCFQNNHEQMYSQAERIEMHIYIHNRYCTAYLLWMHINTGKS